MRLASLRARLFASLVVVIALASLGLGLAAYRGALAEADQLFDYNMRQMALSLRSGNPLASLPAGIENESGWQGIDFAVQVLTLDGIRLFASSRDLVLPERPAPGFSEVVTPHGRFRVFAVATPTRSIQVAQDLAVRERLARGLAWRTIGPVALLLPVLLAVVWWVVSLSLRPVARVRAQVARRAADDLAEVASDGLPDEIRPLVDELNALLGRLRAAFEAQRHFVADAAHELRSPLAALRLQLQWLRRAPDERGRREAMDRLEEGIDRAGLLVEQLLLLARQQASAAAAESPAAVDLAALARDAVVTAADAAGARQVDVGFVEAGGDGDGDGSAGAGAAAASHPLAVLGQPEALQVLLGNLLGNAIKYTPPGGAVDVRVAAAPDGAVVLTVEDSGPGIPPAERGRVFDRFYRGPSHDPAIDGNGLGLAIVRAIADRHGASVVLDESPSRGGLRVTVRFPVAGDAAES